MSRKVKNIRAEAHFLKEEDRVHFPRYCLRITGFCGDDRSWRSGTARQLRSDSGVEATLKEGQLTGSPVKNKPNLFLCWSGNVLHIK